MIELKKCPFCGADNLEMRYDNDGYYSYYWVTCCRKCDCMGASKPTEQEAVAAWNRRAQDE